MSDLLSSANPAWLLPVLLEGVRRLAKGREQLAAVQRRSADFVRSTATVELQVDADGATRIGDPPSLERAAAIAVGGSFGHLKLRTSVVQAGSGAATIHLLRHSFYRAGQKEPLGSLVEKVIQPPPGRNIAYLWAQEAAVYAHAQSFRDSLGVRLPACYGLSYRRGRIHLYLEDLAGLRHPRAERQLLWAAESLGHFGGWAAREGVWKQPWLSEPSGSTGALSFRGSRVKKNLGQVIVARSAIEQLLRDYQSLRKALPAARQLIQASPSTIAHLDAHSGNLLLPKSGGRPFLLDWAKAGRGRLGDDLLRLASARHYLLNRGASLEDFLSAEAALLERYLEGAERCLPRLTSEDVRHYFHLRSLIGSVRWLERGGQLSDSFLRLKRKEQLRRREAMEAFLFLQIRRAKDLL